MCKRVPPRRRVQCVHGQSPESAHPRASLWVTSGDPSLRAVRRQDVQIFTKLCCVGREQTNMTREWVKQRIDLPCRRLGVESIDLVQMYWNDYSLKGACMSAPQPVSACVVCTPACVSVCRLRVEPARAEAPAPGAPNFERRTSSARSGATLARPLLHTLPKRGSQAPSRAQGYARFTMTKCSHRRTSKR